MMVRSILVLLALAALAGCVLDHGVAGDPSHTCGDSMQMTFDYRIPHISPVDVLVVVDNSLSMAEEQASFVEAFPHLIRSLLEPDEGTPVRDMHIGVVSTDMGTGGYSVETCSNPVDGDDGTLRHEPSPAMTGCDAAYPTYLRAEMEEPDSAMIEKLIEDFGCIAMLGIDGCGFEQQLKAARKALVYHRDRTNAGFLRDDSILVVLFLSDEEDCSVAVGGERLFDPLDTSLGIMCRRCLDHPELIEPVQTYIDAFRSLRPSNSDLLLGFIVGVPRDSACEGPGSQITGCLDHPDMIERVGLSGHGSIPACVTSTGEANPGRRFVEIATALGDSGFVGSICRDDYSPAIKDMAHMVREKIGDGVHLHALPMEKVPGDPSVCRASCMLVEELADMRPCFMGTTLGTHVDEDGLHHTLCEVPQVMTVIDDPRLGCEDPFAHLEPGPGAGWIYLPRTPSGPLVRFTGDTSHHRGSALHFSCCFK